MNSYAFIFISLLAGVIAGLILAGVNYFVAEPYIDQAIGIEIENGIAAGETVDFDELNTYSDRTPQAANLTASLRH